MSTAPKISTQVNVIQQQIRALIHLANRPQQLDGCDLTVAQWRGLIAIGESRSLTVSAVGATLGIGLPASSLLVGRLVRAKLVHRHRTTADRRVVLCALTELGQSLYEVFTSRERELQGWLLQMNVEDQNALEQGLVALGKVAAQTVSVMEGIL